MKIQKALIILCALAVVSITYAAQKEQAEPAAVNVVKAETATWQESIASTGTLVAEEGVVIKPDISGRITKIYFKSGQHVEAGAPLVQIFPDILQAELKQSEATLSLAKTTYGRFD